MRIIYKYDKENNTWKKIDNGISVLKQGDIFGVVNDKTMKPMVDEEGYTTYEVLKKSYLLASNIDSGLCAVDVKPLNEIELKEEYVQETQIKEKEKDKNDAFQSEESGMSNRESV